MAKTSSGFLRLCGVFVIALTLFSLQGCWYHRNDNSVAEALGLDVAIVRSVDQKQIIEALLNKIPVGADVKLANDLFIAMQGECWGDKIDGAQHCTTRVHGWLLYEWHLSCNLQLKDGKITEINYPKVSKNHGG